MFPILRGRLLKRVYRKNKYWGDMFPILGGRLLKVVKIAFPPMEAEVSNPWREAIEAISSPEFLLNREPFPILGGRLLKCLQIMVVILTAVVSNPWREAIED